MATRNTAKPCILGIDPGTNNLAYAVFRLDSTKTGGAVNGLYVETGMLNATMRTLTIPAKLKEEREAFLAEVNGILSRNNVQAIILERYMSRPGMGGTAIESINQMIGVLQMLNLPTKIIPSSQWKNDVTQGGEGIDLEDLYIQAKYAANRSPHEVDAACITMYGVSRLLNQTPEYEKVVQGICNIERSSLGVTTKPKPKKKRRRSAKPK